MLPPPLGPECRICGWVRSQPPSFHSTWALDTCFGLGSQALWDEHGIDPRALETASPQNAPVNPQVPTSRHICHGQAPRARKRLQKLQCPLPRSPVTQHGVSRSLESTGESPPSCPPSSSTAPPFPPPAYPHSPNLPSLLSPFPSLLPTFPLYLPSFPLSPLPNPPFSGPSWPKVGNQSGCDHKSQVMTTE